MLSTISKRNELESFLTGVFLETKTNAIVGSHATGQNVSFDKVFLKIATTYLPTKLWFVGIYCPHRFCSTALLWFPLHALFAVDFRCLQHPTGYSDLSLSPRLISRTTFSLIFYRVLRRALWLSGGQGPHLLPSLWVCPHAFGRMHMSLQYGPPCCFLQTRIIPPWPLHSTVQASPSPSTVMIVDSNNAINKTNRKRSRIIMIGI